MPMGLPERVNEQTYSYADYFSWPEWPEGERYELIHGEALAMRPAPRLVNQTIRGEIQRELLPCPRGADRKRKFGASTPTVPGIR